MRWKRSHLMSNPTLSRLGAGQDEVSPETARSVAGGHYAQCHGLWVFDRLWAVPVLVTAGSPLPAGMPECGVSRRAARSRVGRGLRSGGFAVFPVVRLGGWAGRK